MSRRPLLPREYILANKRRRLLDVAAELIGKHGYEETSIGDVVKRARLARKTLYDNFGGKEELFLATLDAALEQALDGIEEACAAVGEEDWRERIRAGLAALLAYLDEHPAEARMAILVAPAATEASASRYRATVERLTELLRASAVAPPGQPETTEETLVGGIAWILNRQLRFGEADRAQDLLPALSEFLLAPWS